MMPTCAPSTPGESPSCQKISSWPDESEESERSVPPPQKHKHLGPFQDHPHTPKGVAFEELKDPCYKLKYPMEGKICPKYLTNTKFWLYEIDLKLKTPVVDAPIDLTWQTVDAYQRALKTTT